jgi:transcription-repair coupling factor (superfamily II helicase)
LAQHALKSSAWQERLQKLATKSKTPTYFDHVSAAAQGFVCGLILHQSQQLAQVPRVWILTKDLRAQENLSNDLQTWFGPTWFFPEQEQDKTIDGLPDQDIQAERLAILQRLTMPEPLVLVLNKSSLAEEVPVPGGLQQNHRTLRVGEEIELEQLIATLEAADYERTSQVAERGQFAVRGGIVDLFSWHAELPYRLELFDREIESIRTFDPDSQMSIQRIKELSLLLSPGLAAQTCPLSDCIERGDWVVAIDLPETLRATIHVITGAAPARRGVAENFATACHELPLGAFDAGDFVLQQARRSQFSQQIQAWKQAGWKLAMFFNTEGEIQRFRELVPQEAESIECLLGAVNHGFTVPSAKLVVLCDAELFGRYQTTRARRLFGQERRTKARRAPLDLAEMQLGDLVVHLEHGIGKYRGLIQKARHDGLEEDVLVIEYAEDAKLYVPLQHAYLVSRYMGVGKKNPELSKLGDGKWQKTKKAAEKSILDYASELLKIQAERQTGIGYKHQPDTKWQWEFENSFIYKETADQLKAIEDTKQDMESERAMDRLICGDVGFGKTEVAIRAVFKAVMSGKQVAVLCPTTVLAQQHWRTFRERMSDYPIKVELLNRYRSAKETREVLAGLADGSVDICVGTHRLISKDVRYADLGLVVVDEEQRFGVKHKERFKEIFSLVDVLTLSATPIPRTLYLSLMGARDMSTIETPPANRIPVETTILAYDDRVIRKAIDRELKRGGQVYFLHNRVETIEGMAEKIRGLCPQAKVIVGHGQMEEGLLEEVMTTFIEGKADVLVSTTIIESGIDIPNANTIIIDRADRFGLADLYQLRGRVGRAGHKAYAYLMLPSHLLTTTDARKRINAIKQYSSLGSGFKIAMRDLEIRGAGNLLGTQQSGHVIAIGFDLYCQVLKSAIESLKGRRVTHRLEVALDLDFVAFHESDYHARPDKLPAFLTADYMTEAPLRISAYKQMAEVTTQKDLQELMKNWRDRFGPLPPPVEHLCRTVELRLIAHHSGVTAVQVKGEKLMLTRRGDFIQINGKFPRLRPSAKPQHRLEESIALLKQL